jgi:RimJ/RimL family protein N-acetyltransferase
MTLWTPFSLEGPEVTLRPMTPGDAEALAAASGEAREHYGLSFVPDGLEQARRYVEKALRLSAAGARIPFTTIWSGRVVGTTSFLDPEIWDWPPGSRRAPRESPDTVEIGATWLAASAQRTGCNTGAKLLMLTHAFERWEVHGVSFKTDARNQRSRRAIERLGARFDGVRRADMPGADDTVRDSAYYSIVAAEWASVKERLARLSSGASAAAASSPAARP